MAIPLIFKRIAIIFYIQAIKLRFLWSKKEDDYFLVTPLLYDYLRPCAVSQAPVLSISTEARYRLDRALAAEAFPHAEVLQLLKRGVYTVNDLHNLRLAADIFNLSPGEFK